jgi:hypothetical protein
MYLATHLSMIVTQPDQLGIDSLSGTLALYSVFLFVHISHGTPPYLPCFDPGYSSRCHELYFKGSNLVPILGFHHLIRIIISKCHI